MTGDGREGAPSLAWGEHPIARHSPPAYDRGMNENKNGFFHTVKNFLRLAVPIVMLQAGLPAEVKAQEAKAVIGSETPPNAMTLSVRGPCDYSTDGVTFAKLERGQNVEQGAILRTGAEARTDLFFRRTGVTVRLQAGTEIKLEKMTVTMQDGFPIVHTLLDLRTGRIFTVVRSEVAGSTLEIRNAAGRSLVEGSGVGRYIITADGTHVTAEGSAIPLKVIGENGITVIAAGQQFARKEGKSLPVDSNVWVKDLIQLDEVQAVMEEATAKPLPPKT
jgi:hypothetical protein